MKIPAECNKCKEVFDLDPNIKEKHLDLPTGKVMEELFGDKGILCKRCR